MRSTSPGTCQIGEVPLTDLLALARNSPSRCAVGGREVSRGRVRRVGEEREQEMDARLVAYDASVFDYLGNLDCEFYVTVAPMKGKRVPKRENNEGMWKLRAYPRMFETAKLNQKDLGKMLKNVDQAEEDLLYGDECGEDYMKRYMSETRLRAKLQCLAGKLKPLL